MAPPHLILLLGVLAQEPDQSRLAQLKAIEPHLLARAYLVTENTLSMIAMARQGARVVLLDERPPLTVTAANVDSVADEYERRRATYAAAIRARGSRVIAGEYEWAFAKCADASDPALVHLIQNGFLIGLDNEATAGVVVERTLVVGSGAEDAGRYWNGTVREGAQIVLHPFDRSGCDLLFTPYRRPRVQLEHPEQLLGAWEGRWDGTFGVRFTIAPTDSGYDVRYEWQEYEGGEYEADTIHAHVTAANAIRGGAIQIVVEQKGEYGARAVGHFARTRTAWLRRVGGN